LRSGTENIPYCVGLGKALDIHMDESFELRGHMSELRGLLFSELEKGLPPNSFFVNGKGGFGMLPNTLHISLADNLNANKVLAVGDVLACSAGSACHTGEAQAGAMGVLGVESGFNGGNLRLSVGRSSTREEVLSAS
jgi:cysteine desulfurase